MYLASHALYVGVHDVISNVPLWFELSVRMQSLGAPASCEPVLCVVTTIETDVPAAPPPEMARLFTYCVEFDEQPAWSSVPGVVPLCAEVYSDTEVLHAASAARPSLIFERMR